MLLISAGITIPLAGALWAISITGRPDLSNLVPIRDSADGYFMLNWSTLLRDHPHALDAGFPLFVGAPVQALGYLFDGDHARSEGERLRDFVLLPEAGNLFHPVHRLGDQMITVHLAPDARVRFSSRALVWVWGTFRAAVGDPAGAKPLYTLERARVHPASLEEIRRYFK